MLVSPQAFQDGMPHNHCWGCGPANPKGLQIRSYWGESGTSLCDWHPHPEHMAGPTHVLNGGIISTLIDCHGICTAIADAYQREGRAIGEGETIWYVTGNLNVRFLKPTPITAPVHLEATLANCEGRKTWVNVTLFSEGEARAVGEVLAVRVPADWLLGHH
jgi:acyl-coenzyme A thioesterase PaaI-like protein